MDKKKLGWSILFSVLFLQPASKNRFFNLTSEVIYLRSFPVFSRGNSFCITKRTPRRHKLCLRGRIINSIISFLIFILFNLQFWHIIFYLFFSIIYKYIFYLTAFSFSFLLPVSLNRRRRLSVIRAINSEFVGFPLPTLTV